jgi:hypothetical protein
MLVESIKHYFGNRNGSIPKTNEGEIRYVILIIKSKSGFPLIHIRAILGKQGTSYRWGEKICLSSAYKNRKIAFFTNLYSSQERNYEEDEDEDYSIKKLDADFEVAPVTPPSDLSIPLQNLMQLIFNTTFMQLSMASLSYDR